MVRYPEFAPEVARSSDFQISLDGSEKFSPLECRVSAMPYNIWWVGRQRPEEQTELASFASFETDGAVQVELEAAKDFEEVIVRPLSKGVKPEVCGRTIRFTLPGAGQYTVELDGFHCALHLFVNPLKDFGVQEGDENVIYFGPGVHEVGVLEVKSGQTVYLDPAAVVYGCIMGICVEDVKVLGYGIIDGSREVRTDHTLLLPFSYDGPIAQNREGILELLEKTQSLAGCLRIYRGRNVTVEGPVLKDAATFAFIPANVENLTIDAVKTIGMWRYNSDGIDLFNCRNVVMRNCFLRDFDDCIVIKGICGWDQWNNENILVQNCVVWCDWGRALEIGAETNAPLYRNIVFENCDLIHGSTVMMDIQHHNRAEVENILFKNIRCEYTSRQLSDVLNRDYSVKYEDVMPKEVKHPYLMVAEVRDSGSFAKDGLNGPIHDIAFEDIQVYAEEGVAVPVSYFHGTTAETDVKRVRIQNVTFNGKKLTEEEANLKWNDFSEKPSFC